MRNFSLSSGNFQRLHPYLRLLVIGGFIAAMIGNALSTVQMQGQFPQGEIAFASNRDGDFEIFIMSADGTGIRQLTHNEEDDYDPAWNPEGTQLVFTSERTGTREIFVMDIDGSDQSNLTNNREGSYSPAWSPEGEQIAYISEAESHFDIFLMNIDGTHQTNLTYGNGINLSPAWSPNGDRIVFSSTRNRPPQNAAFGVELDLFTMRPDGANVEMLIGGGTGTGCIAW